MRVIVVIVVVLQLINLFFGKKFGEGGIKIFMSIITVLFVIIMILAFGFGKKLEQEKIERENRK